MAARSYSLGKLALLDGDLEAAESHYRAATEGFGRLDRPVMNSMCLGMVADFDERAGDYPAAIKTLEAAIETNESLLGGFTGSLQARLGWVLLHDGQMERAEAVYQRALDSARRVRHTMVIFQAQAGFAVLHRLHRRDDAAVEAASEALELHRADDFRKFRNRIDAKTDLQACAAVCCEVLAAIAAERDEPERRRDAARAGRPPAGRIGRRRAGVPARRRDPGQRGSGGRPGPLIRDFSRSAAGGQRAPGWCSRPRRWRGPVPGGSRERIPVPPRSHQRPAPVPGGGPLARGRRRRHGPAGQRGGRVRQQRTRARRRVPARRRRAERPVPDPGWPVRPHRAPHRRGASRRRRPRPDRRAGSGPPRGGRGRLRGHRPLRPGGERRQRGRADRLPRRHLRAGQAHRHPARRRHGRHRPG